jgi:hypothetical protein
MHLTPTNSETPTMMPDRWRTACHEAGHAVAAVVLGGKCLGVVLYGDGGQAQLDELLGNRNAFAVAAGPVAERLAEQFPAPATPPAETRVLSVDEIEALPVCASAPFLGCQLARTAQDRKGGDSDARSLALWAVTGNEDAPETWAKRVEFARRVADEIVQANAAAIIRVGESLFVYGSLSRDEINQLIGAF